MFGKVSLGNGALRVALAIVSVAGPFAMRPIGAEASGPPVRIGLSLGLTGRYAQLAAYQRDGYLLWLRDVNRRGGILGRPVELTLLDDGSDAATARRLYERLITVDKVDLVFAPFATDLTEAILPVTARHGYPVLAAGASGDRIWEQGYTHVFGLYLPASKISLGFLDMANRYGIRTVAIAHDGSDFSSDFAPGARKWAERFGLRVVLFEKYARAVPHFEALATRAREAGAEAFILSGYLEDAVAVRRAMKEVAWRPRAFYAPVGPGTDEFIDRLGQDANLTFSTSQWNLHGRVQAPESAAFSAAYRAAFGREASYFAATAFAAGQILEAAALQAGRLDRGPIATALAGLDATSIIGHFGVDRTGVQMRNFAFVIQLQDGRRETVWPEESQTSLPVLP